VESREPVSQIKSEKLRIKNSFFIRHFSFVILCCSSKCSLGFPLCDVVFKIPKPYFENAPLTERLQALTTFLKDDILPPFSKAVTVET
jgi:hypothetical protein